MVKAVWLFDTLQPVEGHVNSGVTPRGLLETNTPSAQSNCPWTVGTLCPTLFDPPSFYPVWRKVIYVTDPCKCRWSLPYCFLCLSIHRVAALKKLRWGVASEDRIVTRWCLRFLATQTILGFCEMYEIDICIWSGSNLILRLGGMKVVKWKSELV